MNSDFTEDRGSAQYFHGRKKIRDTFARACRFYKGKGRGTTFLIQGAPGAGKTALVEKLCAEADDWTVASIGAQDLYDPAALAQSLGKSHVLDREIAAKVGIKILEGGYVEHVAGHASSKEILRHLAPENGLILVLDEAQRLSEIPDDSETRVVAMDTLDAIHNGQLAKSVILIAAGLGTTLNTLKSLNISRFMRKCRVSLGCLSHGSTCAVIQAFLKDKGGVDTPSPIWVNAIAEKTYGWPQHIISYAEPAAEYLAFNPIPTDEGLAVVLQQGQEERAEYYEERAAGIDEHLRQALTGAVIDIPSSGTTTRPAIMSILRQSDLNEEEAGNLFNTALEQGILDHRKGGRYGIPIPSFHSWLVDQYGPTRTIPIAMDQQEKSSESQPEKTIGRKINQGMER